MLFANILTAGRDRDSMVIVCRQCLTADVCGIYELIMQIDEEGPAFELKGLRDVAVANVVEDLAIQTTDVGDAALPLVRYTAGNCRENARFVRSIAPLREAKRSS